MNELLPYLVVWIVVPAVANVPEPGFAPQTDEPVHKDGAVEHPPKNDERIILKQEIHAAGVRDGPDKKKGRGAGLV